MQPVENAARLDDTRIGIDIRLRRVGDHLLSSDCQTCSASTCSSVGSSPARGRLWLRLHGRGVSSSRRRTTARAFRRRPGRGADHAEGQTGRGRCRREVPEAAKATSGSSLRTTVSNPPSCRTPPDPSHAVRKRTRRWTGSGQTVAGAGIPGGIPGGGTAITYTGPADSNRHQKCC